MDCDKVKLNNEIRFANNRNPKSFLQFKTSNVLPVRIDLMLDAIFLSLRFLLNTDEHYINLM